MSTQTIRKPPRVPLKTVALPNEHGAWNLVLEPAVLGLVLAPTIPGLLLAIAGVLVLMIQHPLSLVLADARKGRVFPRTILARRFLVGYIAAAGVPVVASVLLAGPELLLPPLLALPVALVQLSYEARNKGRSATAELLGAGVISALVASILVAGGWSIFGALLLWLLVACRHVSSIVYVRTRLRLERGQPARPAVGIATAATVLVLVGCLALFGQVPWLTAVAMALLAGRAGLGLSRLRRPAAAKTIGIREAFFGLAFVTLVALGYLLQI